MLKELKENTKNERKSGKWHEQNETINKETDIIIKKNQRNILELKNTSTELKIHYFNNRLQ